MHCCVSGWRGCYLLPSSLFVSFLKLDVVIYCSCSPELPGRYVQFQSHLSDRPDNTYDEDFRLVSAYPRNNNCKRSYLFFWTCCSKSRRMFCFMHASSSTIPYIGWTVLFFYLFFTSPWCISSISILYVVHDVVLIRYYQVRKSYWTCHER